LSDRNNVIVNLTKGVDVAQIVNFISEQTKKPVLKENSVQGKITVYSANKIPPDQALQLVYDALELQGIAVIETPRAIQLVPADAAKTMRIQILQAEESASSITNRTQIVQKIFKLKTTTPKSVQAALQPLIGKQGSIGTDERTKTVVITDSAANVDRFEQLIAAFDRVESGQITVKILKLQYATADDIADLVAMMAVAGEGGNLPVQQQRSGYGEDRDYRRRFGGGSSGGRMANDVVVLPDARTNWLIVAGPPDKINRIEKMVTELDVPGRTDVKIQAIDIKHADAYDLAMDIREMLTRKISREKQEIFDIRSNQRGNQLIVLATPQMFQMVQDVIRELDTTQSVTRVTRSYDLKYIDANDMADQLNQLYQDERGGLSGYYGYIFGYGGGRSSQRGETKFVPVVRTNSIMVIAQPTEYEFIEKMIKELDVETPEQNLAPRVYHIVHTDASEMVTVLTNLFEGGAGARQTMSPDFFNFRPRGTSRQQGVGALFGKVRFVPYRNTNSIVAITNNPQNFTVIEGLIKDLDVLDPEATNMLVIQIQFADVAQLSNNLNSLLSEGAVSRAPQQARTTGQRTTTGQGTDQAQPEEPPPVEVIFPWQSAQRRQMRPGEEERPISSLINHVRIVPDTRSQKLIVAAPSIYFEAIKKLVEDLDKPEPQVQLETYLVRVDTEGTLRLGWRWTPDPSSISQDELDNAFLGLIDMGFVDTFAGGNPFTQAKGGTTPADQPGVTIASRAVRDTFRGGNLLTYGQTLAPGKGVFSADVNVALLIQLLVKNRNAVVVAHPQITVNNNEKGEVFVGESAPFQTSAQTSAEGAGLRTATEYRDVGTRLTITPQINKQGRVVLKIYIQNQRRKPELILGQPVIENQTYDTKITLENGQKVWLGGLSEQRVDNTIRKFPILGDIPILGFFFRKTDKTTLESKIFTFITPTVIETPQQADAQFARARKDIDAYKKEYQQLELHMPGETDELTSATTAPKIMPTPQK
jgi:type II secretory pathway component GspD/PulD (secretin)